MPIVEAGESTPTGKGNTPGSDAEPADRGDGVDTGDESSYISVDEIELLLMESFPMQVTALVRGHFYDGCGVLDGVSARRTDEGFMLVIAAHRKGDFCAAVLAPFEERVILEVKGLKAGTYRVTAGDISAEFTFDVDNG